MCTVTTPAPLFFSFFHLCCCTNVWSGVEQCLQESRISGTNLNQHMSALLTRWLYFKSACILVCVSAVVLCWATVYHLQVIKQRVTSCLFSKAWQWRQLDISAPPVFCTQWFWCTATFPDVHQTPEKIQICRLIHPLSRSYALGMCKLFF